VLLDLLLPGLSGADLRALQLADPQLAAIPTVVMTACERDVPVYTLLQPAEWIEKPFHWEQLLGVVQRYVTPEKEPGTHLIDWTATP
jgi:FixJ family two-component response regulator